MHYFDALKKVWLLTDWNIRSHKNVILWWDRLSGHFVGSQERAYRKWNGHPLASLGNILGGLGSYGWTYPFCFFWLRTMDCAMLLLSQTDFRTESCAKARNTKCRIKEFISSEERSYGKKDLNVKRTSTHESPTVTCFGLMVFLMDCHDPLVALFDIPVSIRRCK